MNEIFLDGEKFNCPLCSGRGTHYSTVGIIKIYTSGDSFKYVVFVKCQGCKKISMHFILEANAFNIKFKYSGFFSNPPCDEYTYLAFSTGKYKDITEHYIDTKASDFELKTTDKIKKNFLNIHRCIKQDLLVGASAYIRQTLEEIFVSESINTENRKMKEMVDDLKEKYKDIGSEVIDAIKQIYSVSSDTIHASSFLNLTKEEINHLVKCLEHIIKEISNVKERSTALSSLNKLKGELDSRKAVNHKKI